MSDAGYLMAPDGVSLHDTFTMAQSMHTHLWVFLDALMGREHPMAHEMDVFFNFIMGHETELE